MLVPCWFFGTLPFSCLFGTCVLVPFGTCVFADFCHFMWDLEEFVSTFGLRGKVVDMFEAVYILGVSNVLSLS